MKRSKVWIVTCFMLLVCSCHQTSEDDQSGEPVVRAGEYSLYKSDLRSALPVGVHGADSVQFAEKYIRTWVEDMLMYQQAVENLPDGKEIDERVEAYRRALTVHIYQEKLVEQELGSKVADSEIETYYNTHSEQFVATEPYLKGVFMKVPLHAASLKNVRAWMKNPEGNGNLDRLEKYSISHAVSYECFPDRWKPFSEISLQMPLVKKDLDNLRGHRSVEVSDSAFRYLLHVCEVLPVGERVPLEYASGEIREILVNLKRAEYIGRMKSDLYKRALEDKKIIYYN
ncbi:MULTISPECIES: peptidyl-prolyl cis-trans isomerase [Bacteroides]|uniref:Peptidyl-prolyl cis-trans isomerase n=2 Tax=Bacteroidaceae TaxID=815 RepID=A0ABT7VG93_9BACE|nr:MULTISPECIES: peptidyl-prolyl cis-trans isomerase [Bacteroides]MBU3857266.1 peptidyl-prolyl cis-trans isomerase [Candidatus Phocaeicola excrementipullorum]MBW9200075.1 peptidyl-prolyl cis-trans isomerase [Bacteroidales bacterium SW299]MCR8917924.1 peptidyl-prolyl cis-trans isomerase [Bacteroides sp. ET225]MDM8207679.1 peptidyl-prolyl cis-trans isomerase [Bacteroides gallinaceum]MDM8325317.1 peptidyl-prolyl cis-trans isomerase [Bacteroides gallinaceum]